MQLSLFLCVGVVLACLLNVLAVADTGIIRDYVNRSYYTLYSKTADVNAVTLVARRLGARFEGKVGELDQYYWISTARKTTSQKTRRDNDVSDKTIALFHSLKQRSELNLKRDELSIALAKVDGITAQIPRQRLVKRAVIPKRQLELLDDPPESAPVVENALAEQKLNNELPLATLLDEPGGFENVRNSLDIYDPGFAHQWHLVNQEQRGHDLNITGVWSQGITGQGVVVAILDDGLDMDSQDLKDNFFAPGSYDFNARTALPKPKLSDDTHGTRCAGEIAAARNDICGVGVAYDAKVAGIRILSDDITDADEAEALNYEYQQNHIYSCSWGPPDLGEVVEAPQEIVMDAIKNGIVNGRGGKGTIFVFATGNGGANDDNCNYDGYTNSLYTITVGAIDRLGNHPYYAEQCSAQLVVTYSSGSGSHIYTTDVGHSKCTDQHGGTSAAAPLAAGVFALVLSVRPDLTWRDLQHLCVETAVPISLDDADWVSLPSGRLYNHKFGYGRLDAFAIVERAKTFVNVRSQTFVTVASELSEELAIPDLSDTMANFDKSLALASTITVTKPMVDEAGLGRLEHITVTVHIEHERRGDLEILLESPQEVVSQLGTSRRYDVSTHGLVNWTFMSVKHWDENPIGNWTLRVIDGKNPAYTGKLISWSITLWGELAEGFERVPTDTPESEQESTDPETSNIEPTSLETFEEEAEEEAEEVEEEGDDSMVPATEITLTATDVSNTLTTPDLTQATSSAKASDEHSVDFDASETRIDDDQQTEYKRLQTMSFAMLSIAVCATLAILVFKYRRRIRGTMQYVVYTSVPSDNNERHLELDPVRKGRVAESSSKQRDNVDNTTMGAFSGDDTHKPTSTLKRQNSKTKKSPK